MTSSALQERFLAVSERFGVQDWALLGALACEQALPQSVIEQLSPPPAMPAAAWLKSAQAQGWVVAARPLRSASLKPHFSVHTDFQQLILRQLARREELENIAVAMRRLLTVRSVSDLTLALQRGESAEFERRYAARARPPEVGPSTRAEWWRRALTEPFDPEWLEQTFGGQALSVATRVLEECLLGPSACDELLAWLELRDRALLDADARASLAAVLAQHAILRGAPERALELGVALPSQQQLGFSAAARFAAGDLADAQARLDRLLGPTAGRGSVPDCGALAPLLSLLLCARGNEPGWASAKRLLGAGNGELNRGAQRAFRTLWKHLSEPPENQRRLDVHQLSGDIGAWELLILALTVHLHSPDKWARANWCQDLSRRAKAWHESGYTWLARQAWFLAELLNQEHFQAEAARLGVAADARRSSRELALWDLISIKPEWQKALEALAQISDKTAERAQAQRVAWYVDMARGELNRPALQECRPSEGWSEGRRVTLAELWPIHGDLPAEDQRVLNCTRETERGVRDFTPEAAEALIGHPRVVNGLRQRSPVQVTRGTPRLETREERGYVEVFVEPANATLGVNLVPEGETRLVVYRVGEAIARAAEALRFGARIPKSHERELLSVLGKLSESVDVRSPELGSERTVAADPTPCLRFALHAGAWLVQLGVRPFSEQGRFFLAGVGRASLTLYEGGQRLRCERDLELEREKSLALQRACPTLSVKPDPSELSPLDAPDSWTLGEVGVLELLSELRTSNVPCALEWPEASALKLSAQLGSKALHGRLRSDKGWYLVTGGLRLDSITELSLSELLRAPMLAQGRFLRLPSGDFVEVEARLRRVIAALKAVNSKPGAGANLRLPASALFALSRQELEASGFDFDPDTDAWLERAARLSEREFPLPEGLCATLRPYQLDGFRWLSYLSELGLGACLADDMGLGKTVQILALLMARASRGLGPMLVVAPTSVCGNWLSEIRRFAPSLVPLDYVGKERSKLLQFSGDSGALSVVVCSYTILQQDQAELSALSWDTVVLDEAQFIKNSQSLRAKAAYSLRAKQRIAATGTPIENHLGDLWGIFEFLNPGLLGDWPHFKRTFLMPVERDGGRESTELLQKLLKPFLLRRLKHTVLSDLPPLTDVQHDVHLSHDEALRYALLRKQIHQKLYNAAGKRNNKLEVLAEIMRLRRFCCHPALVFPDAPRECSKIDAFLELVLELRENQHRALVFSQFVDFLALVREQLDERGIEYEYLDGSTPQSERQARVSAFQEGDAPLFLISLKAGGFGLNLTAADYVIHLDPWWNPAVQAQATDRAHRIGQERPVTVYRLITKETIEDKIVKLHESKQQLASSLLAGGDAVGGLDANELLELVTATLAEGEPS